MCSYVAMCLIHQNTEGVLSNVRKVPPQYFDENKAYFKPFQPINHSPLTINH